jgi:hypothetical protein
MYSSNSNELANRRSLEARRMQANQDVLECFSIR